MKVLKMKKRHPVFLLVVITFTLNLLTVCNNVSAQQPVVKLVKNPDVQEIYLSQERIQKICIIAQSDRTDSQYRWNLVGPGELPEDKTSPGIFYIPPDTIEVEPTQVTITVTVTDSSRNEVTESVTFTLKKSVSLLLSEGDYYFYQKLWIVTKGKGSFERVENPEAPTAFNRYRQVLEIEPQNTHAWEGMQNILKFYKEEGLKSYERWENNGYKKTDNITGYDKQYLWVVQELKKIRQDFVDPNEEEVQKRLNTYTDPEYLRIADIYECADAFLIKQKILPNKDERGEFAFYFYQDILKQYPLKSKYARNRILEIIKNYKEWGDFCWETCSKTWEYCGSAKTYYEKYQFVATYSLEILKDSLTQSQIDSIKTQLNNVTGRLQSLKNTSSKFSREYAENYKNP